MKVLVATLVATTDTVDEPVGLLAAIAVTLVVTGLLLAALTLVLARRPRERSWPTRTPRPTGHPSERNARRRGGVD